MIEHLEVQQGIALQLLLEGRPKGLSGRRLARAQYSTRRPPRAATLSAVLSYMNWERLEAKLGVWATELLAGTPTPHAAVMLDVLRQAGLKGGMMDVLLTQLPLTYKIVESGRLRHTDQRQPVAGHQPKGRGDAKGLLVTVEETRKSGAGTPRRGCSAWWHGSVRNRCGSTQ